MNDKHPSLPIQPASPQTAAPEPFEKLSALAIKNGFRPRQMAGFVARGLRVVRPSAGGRAAYSRQSWLDAFLASDSASNLTPDKERS